MSVTAKKKSGCWESVNDGVESSGEVREREIERESGCVNHRIRMTKMVFFYILESHFNGHKDRPWKTDL